MQIFAGVRDIWGIKEESGRLRCRFSYLSLAIFSESSSPKLKSATHSICVKLFHKHDKRTQCCHAFTLALARLSCIVYCIILPSLRLTMMQLRSCLFISRHKTRSEKNPKLLVKLAPVIMTSPQLFPRSLSAR